MRTSLIGRGLPGIKRKGEPPKWPKCFRVTLNGKQWVSGLRDETSSPPKVWYAVIDGVYEMQEPTREDVRHRYWLVKNGEAREVDAEEAVRHVL